MRKTTTEISVLSSVTASPPEPQGSPMRCLTTEDSTDVFDMLNSHWQSEDLPNSPGLYAFVKERLLIKKNRIKRKVLYIGKAKKIYTRIAGHNVLPRVKAAYPTRMDKHGLIYEDVRVFSKQMDTGIDAEEMRLIGTVNPKFNVVGKRP